MVLSLPLWCREEISGRSDNVVHYETRQGEPDYEKAKNSDPVEGEAQNLGPVAGSEEGPSYREGAESMMDKEELAKTLREWGVEDRNLKAIYEELFRAMGDLIDDVRYLRGQDPGPRAEALLKWLQQFPLKREGRWVLKGTEESSPEAAEPADRPEF